MKKGFTLIELLVVIAIIAILVAFISANFLSARQRAKDVKKKAELVQLKNALRLYYNDFNIYPAQSTPTTNNFSGCGNATPPSSDCATACLGQFAAGPTGCDTLYMKQLPPASDYAWSYVQRSAGDDFCMWATLENGSDPDIEKSHIKCSALCPMTTVIPDVDYPNAYALCAD